MESRTLRKINNEGEVTCDRCERKGVTRLATHSYIGCCTGRMGLCLCSDCAKKKENEEYQEKYGWMAE